MTRQFQGNEAGVFFTATVVLALASWSVSFALGAYGEVFYTSVLTIWIASLAALFASAVIGRTQEGETYFTWWGAVLLLLPSLLLTSALWYIHAPWPADILEWALLLSLPYIAYVLLVVSAQEAMELKDSRLIMWLIFGFVLLNSISYLAGLFNYNFLTCGDFTIAGDEAPLNCWK